MVRRTLESEGVLNGMQEIADYMRKSRPTIHRWVHQLGFPVMNPGPGAGKKCFTTKLAIAMWVMAISKSPDQYPSGGLPDFVKDR